MSRNISKQILLLLILAFSLNLNLPDFYLIGTEARTTQGPDTAISPEDIAEQASPAVVTVNTYRNTAVQSQGGDILDEPISIRQKISSGTGFFITSDGYLLTNKHVVSEEDAAEYTISGIGDTEIPAEVIYRDPDYDIAVIKVEGENFPILELDRSFDLTVGEQVVVIGNAFGEFTDSVSVGNIAATNRSIVVRNNRTFERMRGLIQTSAKLYPGDSGGPLLNSEGKVVGVNVATSTRTQTGFSIPIKTAQTAIERSGIEIG